ncbi:MAG: bifunctional UDP-N-acetylglucosamine diphosphorylase/glucosamine-1-phosphate N-acetyltransferase GlmU [Massiliimalia sp.]
MNKTSAIILAGGKGTRMNSQKPKVLSEILFEPMLGYVIRACQNAGIADICVVTGYQSQMVEDYLKTLDGCFTTVHQQEQKGTGHAVMMAAEFLRQHQDGDVLILNGDAPCIDADTIQKAYELHQKDQNGVTLITAVLDDALSYGRIIRDETGSIQKIVEKKDASEQELAVREINSGEYWFQSAHLLKMLEQITPDNAQQEYYLTDTVALTLKAGEKVGGYIAENTDVVLGANSRKDLYELNQLMRWKVIERHMENGVEFVSTDGVYICPDAVIGSDTVILPGTILKSGTVIGSGCTIGPNTLVSQSTIGDRVKLNSVQCYQSRVHEDVDIGPFVHIRPNSEIHHHVHIGDFVEVKNSTIGAGTGISHLTYVGDSDVGKNVNFGCGVVTVNYDGVHKHRCVIGDGAFIGCNTNLVAPVEIGENGYTAAGSTITENVPGEALGIARARQVIKEGFSTKKLAGRKKKV